jgi:glycosyltransferase involved in cell wall biosynthesis
VDEVVVVDDHSTDTTAIESLQAGAVVIANNGHRGVGAAIKAGYREAIRREGDILVVVAADLQHDPAEIPSLLEPILHSQAEYVTGSRLYNSPVHQGMPPHRYLGNLILTFLTRLATGVDVKDAQCGFTAITREALEKTDLTWLPNSWGVTNGLIAECKRNKIRIEAVPISTHYGKRRSYIHLSNYVPCMLRVLAGSFLRIRASRHLDGE